MPTNQTQQKNNDDKTQHSSEQQTNGGLSLSSDNNYIQISYRNKTTIHDHNHLKMSLSDSSSFLSVVLPQTRLQEQILMATIIFVRAESTTNNNKHHFCRTFNCCSSKFTMNSDKLIITISYPSLVVKT